MTKRNYKMNNFDGTLIDPNPVLFAQQARAQTVKTVPVPWSPGLLIANLATAPSVIPTESGPRRTLSAEAQVNVLDAFPVLKKLLTGQ